MFFFHCTSSMKFRSIMHVETDAAWAMVISNPPSTSFAPNAFLNSSVNLEVSPRVFCAASESPLRRSICSTAFSVMPLASGSGMDVALVSSAGRSRGRKGAASTGLSTSLDMLLMMTALWRLVAVVFSRRPRSSSGTTMASAGDSTLWTKVTPAISCMISGTSLGLVMAVRILGVMCSMSLLPMTLSASRMASLAAFLICFFVSHMQAVTSGTTSGRALESCFGALSPNNPRHFSDSSRTCHFCSTGSFAKMMGNSDFMAKGLTFVQIANAASEPAFWTALLLLPACSRHAARHIFVTAWASGAPSAKALTSARCARATASSFDSALPASAWMLAASPDFSMPFFFTSSTSAGSSPSDNFSNADSMDISSSLI
mmetsp:Transcript_38984/g.93818  ORF Transcript_38984/g.93818 Transcript_38984/m.93818 type:complete len:373 (+) Transcript_38984:2053-3171(+)